jgi:hypothetical protein
VGDYLEKIFQIPIWMAPIESRTRAALVNTLLGPTASPQPRRTGQTAQVAAETAASAKPAADPEEGALKALVSKARETPDPLQISAAEAGFIDEIAVLLSDRPRALKRLVNIYRLLKASLPDIERASFVDAGESSAYRICLTQLALFTSHPRLAPTLVAAIGEPEEDADPVPDDGLTLESWLLALPEPVEPDLATAIRLLPNRGELLLGPFRRWLPYTSRHLFHRAG